jgi:hypothetical protein
MITQTEQYQYGLRRRLTTGVQELAADCFFYLKRYFSDDNLKQCPETFLCGPNWIQNL